MVRRRWGALLGSWEIPLEACPELGTPATPVRPRISVARMLPSALLTASASQPAEFSELNLHGLLPCCVRFAPTSHPVNGNTRFRSVCSTVTERDLHPLDSIKKFHRSSRFLLFQTFPSAMTMSALSSMLRPHFSMHP